ncbi:MAG: acetyltransferase [Neobacillus sp.]|nr:acetyltransferase [Neobacillus sp.]
MCLLIYGKERLEINIRRAHPTEAKKLTHLAIESKSYWNYSSDYLDKAKEHLKVTEQDIVSDMVYIAEDVESIKGFYCFKFTNEKSELIWFFVAPDNIGKGVGTILWKHLLDNISNHSIDQFIIKSDPFAAQFYIKKGAVLVGSSTSSVDSSIEMPLLLYKMI